MSEPSAEPPILFTDPSLGLEERVNDLVARLGLEEKVTLMAGSAAFTLEGCARLGVSRIRVTDGPTGVRSHEGEAATVFPVGVAIASTWNPDLTREVAAAIAREALAFGNQVVLAPTINIVRTPLWGRNFETWSEDPHLTGELGVAFVEGLQGEGVGASLKHFAANNQEVDRMTLDVRMGERTLREIYLAAFETVVRRAEPWTVMASYNRIDGVHASENRRLLTDILKGEWGYGGVVVSDWGAVHSTARSVAAGMDLEMPGPPRWFGDKLVAAVQAGAVPMARIDDAARRLARLILRTGILDGPPRPGELRTARHRQIAARAAEEGTLLLRNEGDLLPFDPDTIRSVAVVGPNADARRIQGGGSSQVRPARRTSLLHAIEEVLAGRCEIVHADGGDNEPVPPAARPERFSPDESRGETGLLVEYFPRPDFTASPMRAGVERRIGKLIATGFGDGRRPDFEAFRWRGWFWPEKDGRHEFGVRAGGAARLIFDGDVLIDDATPALASREDVGGAAVPHRIAARDLLAGRGYPITIEYRRTAQSRRLMWETIVVGVRAPRRSVAEAAAIAAAADVAIVVIGAASTTEGEGYDRETLDLPGDQDALVEAVLAANPRTAVVLIGGAPYAMPWVDHAPAVLVPWLGGEEGPAATARILFGIAEPSGRLPVSWPRRLEDTAAHPFYPGDGTADHGEGLFVGYRHFDRAATPPLFPFGFGLTYTRFAYSDLVAPEEAPVGEAIDVRFRLANLGQRAGKEVAQLYVRPRGPSVERPVKELKAFTKVALGAGEARDVRLTLDARAFSFWDLTTRAWLVEPGAYDLLIGGSAADIELQATVRLTP